jgi:hypothetical protein
MVPTPERYQEIQQALVSKGYGPGTPDGVWVPDWVAALKHYQQDQKLEATGKLNALSLITLGLGPKREPVGATPPAAPPPPAPEAQREPAGATPPPAPPAHQSSSSSSTVRELK